MKTGRILVTGAEAQTGVAVARGLHQAGFDVAGAAARAHLAPGHWSRSVRERLHVPPPLEDPQGFIDALERVVATGRYSVLLPAGDASLWAISSGRRRLDPYVRIPLPAHDVVERSLDRRTLVSVATRHGLGTPLTVACADATEAQLAAREIGYPVIVKPIRTIFQVNGAHRRIGARLVRDDSALQDLVAGYGGACLVQRRERGALLSFGGVVVEGRLVAVALSRYHRTWRPQAGQASFSQTIASPPWLERRVESLLAELGWEGLFELELMHLDDGRYAALDFNPRPYGSLALAIGAGANLPAIWCRHVLGMAPQRARARPGMSYRREDTDMFHALWQAWHGNLAAAAQPLRMRRGVIHAFYQPDDPGPLVARLLFLVKRYSAQGRVALRERACPSQPAGR